MPLKVMAPLPVLIRLPPEPLSAAGISRTGAIAAHGQGNRVACGIGEGHVAGSRQAAEGGTDARRKGETAIDIDRDRAVGDALALPNCSAPPLIVVAPV